MDFTWDDLTGDPHTSGDQLVYERCPTCGAHWKLYVNPVNGAWFCFDGGHYRGGRLPARAGERIVFVRDTPGTNLAFQPIEIPNAFPLTAEALAYLARRGIDPQWARAFGLCQSGDHIGRIVIPFFHSGEIVYWTARAYNTEARGPKYLAAPGMKPLYAPVIRASNPGVVIVEGPFDAMKVAMAHYEPVALCGKRLPEYLVPHLRRRVAGRPVTVVLDRDAIGDAIRIANCIGEFADCTIKLCPSKDPGDMTPDEIRKLLERP